MATATLNGEVATNGAVTTTNRNGQKRYDKYPHLRTGPVLLDPFIS